MRPFCGIMSLGLVLVSAALAAAEPLPLFTAEAVATPLEYRVDGVVEARRQATISAEVAGKIETVNFDVDDAVEQGAVVVRIRDLEYRARLENAQAGLEQARLRKMA